MEQVRFLYIKSIQKSRLGARFHHPYRRAIKKYKQTIKKSGIHQVVISKSVLQKLRDSNELEELLQEVQSQEVQVVVGDGLALRFVPRLLEAAYEYYGINRKDIRPAVLDRDDIREWLHPMLSQICDDLNYLAIVTKQPDFFKEFAETVYEETGLPIRFATHIPQEANILVDLRQLYREECRFAVEGQKIDSGLLEVLLTDMCEEEIRAFDVTCSTTLKHFPKRILNQRQLS